MAGMKTSRTTAAIGAATAGALLISAAPARAADYYDRDGIGAGEIIAGAVVIGGLAAILASDNDRHDARYSGRYDNRRGYGHDYGRYGDSRSAVSQCVAAVQRDARRYGRANVTDVTSIDRKRDGYRVKGRVVVTDGYRGYRGQRGYRDDGKFTCDIRYGRVENIRLSGLR